MEFITDCDLGYAAGIIDGEGHIGLSIAKGSTGNDCYYARLTVHMKDPQAITFLCNLFEQKLRYSTMNGKKYYSFYCNSDKLKLVLSLLIPYLKVKREVAKVVFSFLEISHKQIPIRKNGKFRGSMPVPQEVIDARKILFAKFLEVANHYTTHSSV